MAAPWRIGCRYPREQEPTWITRRRSWLPYFGSQSFPKSNTWYSLPILDCHHVDLFRNPWPIPLPGLCLKVHTLEGVLDLLNGGLRLVSEQCVHAHNNTRSAEPTLGTMTSGNSFLKKKKKQIKKRQMTHACVIRNPSLQLRCNSSKAIGGHHQVTKPLWGTGSSSHDLQPTI